MNNKKMLMAVSAIMIIIFHLWIYLFNANIFEVYLKQICFIGVDIFFFVSAYNIGKKNLEYKKFIKNRFLNIYLKFVFFALVACIYQNWNVLKLFKVIIGLDFILKGGGAFLWFVPALMIMYLLLPLYKYFDEKYGVKTFIVTLILYVSILLLFNLVNYKEIFIFLNRMPIIIIGYYFAKWNVFEKLRMNKVKYMIISVLLFICGTFISYFVFVDHFKLLFFNDIFYITAIPLILGLILLIDLLPNNKISNFLASFTLELYAIQMIFGFNIANNIYSFTNNIIITNISTIIIVIIISFLIKKILEFAWKQIKFYKSRELD